MFDTNKNRDIRQIQSLQLQQMVSGGIVSLATSTLLALILAYTQREVIAPGEILTWLSAVIFLNIFRMALMVRHQRSKAPFDDPHPLLVNFRVGVVMSGLVWGSASFSMFPANNPAHQMFLIFMLAGLTAGGVATYAADFVSLAGFCVAALVPLAARLFSAGGGVSTAMGMAITLYFGFMIVSGKKSNQHLRDNIVLRLEATARENAIRSSEEQFRLLLSHSPVGILHYDPNLVITYCNHRLAEILKSSVDRIIGFDMKTLKDNAFLPVLTKALTGQPEVFEGHYFATISDENGWIAMTCAPARNIDDKIVGGIAIVQDISERKRAEQTEKRLTRAFRLLSRCGSAIAHAENEAELLTEICKLAVETGGYLMAWVGYALNDAAKTVKPVAQSGHEEGYLESVDITWGDTESGQGPVGTAIRTGQAFVIQDVRSNPKMMKWRAAAIRRGYQSCMSIPLEVNKQKQGAFTIYSIEPFAFGTEEVALLEELANELAYGIQTLRTRVEHEESQIALKRENEKNSALLRNASDGIHILDHNGNIIEVSESFGNMLGYDRAELIGMNVSQWDAGFKNPEELQEFFRKQFANPIRIQFETSHRRKDGTIFAVEVSGFPLELDGQPVIFNSSRDITERIAAEMQNRIAATAFESQEGMFITDADSNILRVNRAFTHITGYSANEAIGKSLRMLNSGFQDDNFHAVMWNSVNETGVWEGEIWDKRKNGEIYPERLSITAVKDANGKVENYVVSLTDITLRRKSEEEIQHLAFYDHLTDLPNRRLLERKQDK